MLFYHRNRDGWNHSSSLYTPTRPQEKLSLNITTNEEYKQICTCEVWGGFKSRGELSKTRSFRDQCSVRLLASCSSHLCSLSFFLLSVRATSFLPPFRAAFRSTTFESSKKDLMKNQKNRWIRRLSKSVTSWSKKITFLKLDFFVFSSDLGELVENLGDFEI